ncbi:hypothetical protein AVEN_247762-1 [Araneus ventricosus]|uniref:Uncharacterized protein n=1 Tax=Araneus ventricosus TaxID=182803 RepID=A0A4Y2HKV9_ARAVE|nr:hypothetical protein AVEN_247762-1 [Araneus ventricosus]
MITGQLSQFYGVPLIQEEPCVTQRVLSILRWAFKSRLLHSIWPKDRFVFHPFWSIDLGGSFTEDRLLRSNLLPSHTWGISLFGWSSLPSLISPIQPQLPGTFSLSNAPIHTRVIYRPPRRIVFHFYGQTGWTVIERSWNSKLSVCLRQFPLGFHMAKRFGTCSKKNGLDNP